ncbi:MAG: ester cyclase [Ignavibacteriaceae bacterium]|jgi:hypothetical protein|nr:ester cyclase [Ignavibacteriaceae bacterium]
MENTKIVEELFQSIEKNDFTRAESLLSKDFKITGIGPEGLGAKEFLGVHKAFNKGMPDFKFNYKIGSESQNIVEAKVKLTGTHTKEMPGPIPGIHTIPATNKSLRMPEEKVKVTLKDGKIVNLYVENVPGGGVPGILKQLGVEIPTEVRSH